MSKKILCIFSSAVSALHFAGITTFCKLAHKKTNILSSDRLLGAQNSIHIHKCFLYTCPDLQAQTTGKTLDFWQKYYVPSDE